MINVRVLVRSFKETEIQVKLLHEMIVFPGNKYFTRVTKQKRKHIIIPSTCTCILKEIRGINRIVNRWGFYILIRLFSDG